MSSTHEATLKFDLSIQYTLYDFNTQAPPAQTKRTVTRHQECCVTKTSKNPTAEKTPPFYPCQIYIPLVQNNFITSFPGISRASQGESPHSQKKKRASSIYCTKTFRVGVRGQTSEFSILVILVLVGLALFADRDFDALCGE